MERENIYVDVNTVVDVLRDTKALYSILVKYTKDFLENDNLYELELLQNVNPEEFAKLFNDLLPLVKQELSRYKREERRLSPHSLKDRIYKEIRLKHGLDKYPSELIKIMTYVLIDFIRAKSNYYRSSTVKLYIKNVSNGSIIVTLITEIAKELAIDLAKELVKYTVTKVTKKMSKEQIEQIQIHNLCMSAMAIAEEAQRNGRKVKVRCNPNSVTLEIE